jgi:hypothetical protein
VFEIVRQSPDGELARVSGGAMDGSDDRYTIRVKRSLWIKIGGVVVGQALALAMMGTLFAIVFWNRIEVRAAVQLKTDSVQDKAIDANRVVLQSVATAEDVDDVEAKVDGLGVTVDNVEAKVDAFKGEFYEFRGELRGKLGQFPRSVPRVDD